VSLRLLSFFAVDALAMNLLLKTVFGLNSHEQRRIPTAAIRAAMLY
jgi:hypothetical protein